MKNPASSLRLSYRAGRLVKAVMKGRWNRVWYFDMWEE